MKLPTLWPKRTRDERRAMTLRDPDGWGDLLGTQTASGIVLTADAALGHPAVLGAVRLLAELMASLPLVVYRHTDTGRERAEDHPVYRLLHDAPNEAMSPFTFKETLALHLFLYGNAYALIIRDNGRPAALWPLHPSRVSLVTEGGVFRYRVQGEDSLQFYPATDVIHVPILAPDGLRGQSPITLAREAIGAALAAEEHAARFFANGAQPSGVLTYPSTLTPEAAERLKRSWNAAHGGPGRHGTAVLEGGMKFEPISSTAKDAQLIEARQFAMRLVAAALRIPPHLLDPEARGAYANVETQSLEFLTFSLQPLLTRFEEAFTRKLFAPGEPYFAEFLVDGILRADTKTRYDAYEVGIRARFLTVDEVRARENLPPLPTSPDERHDHEAVEHRALSPHDRLQAEMERRFEAALTRIVERESADVLGLVERHLGQRDVEQLAVLLADYYAKAVWMADEVLEALNWAAGESAKLSLDQAGVAMKLGLIAPWKEGARVALDEARERLVKRFLAEFLEEHKRVSMAELLSAARTAATSGEMLETIENAIARWAGVRPGKASKLWATVLRNEAALDVYRRAGARKLRWVAGAGSCDYCKGLHGKVVGIGEPFVAVGERLAGPGGRMDRPMVARYPRVRPPVHLGCTCSIEIAG